MRPSVVITREPPGDCVERISQVADVWMWPYDRPIDHDILRDKASTADGLYCMLTDPIDESLLAASPSLSVVSTMAVGVDNIDLVACRNHGVAVGHTPDVLTGATADMAWALLMAASRRIEESAAFVKDGQWLQWEPDAVIGYDVHGTTLGIVGMGRIGRAVAHRAEGFDMDVIFSSRSPVDEAIGIQVPFDELLARSDHVVISLPLTPTTRGLFDADAFRAMKPTANLVNIARGPIVVTDALHEALVEGEIRCAALDVTDPEPIPADHPLVHLPNCLVVPHVGSASHSARIAMADLAAENLLAGLADREMPARVV